MDWMTAALLGLVGSCGSELLVQSSVLMGSKRWPWRSRRQIVPYSVGLASKIIGSAVFTGALAATGWVDSPAGIYVLIGAIAPAIQQRVAAVTAVVLFGNEATNLPSDTGADENA